jgi:hypothetical protein
LAIWVGVTWALDVFIIEPMKLSGLDALMASIFRYAFAGSTLLAVVIFIGEDLFIMVVQAWRRVRTALKH